MNVARFFALGLLGPESSSYLGSSGHAARTIAANGLRLVLDEHRSTDTPVRKDGTPGQTKVTYADPERATAWLWKFIDGAKTAGELYGRVLVVFAAQHYALQIALPTAQRRSSVLPSSRKDHARKAFEKLTKSHLPATYGQLARAIEHEAREHRERADEHRHSHAAASGVAVSDSDSDDLEPSAEDELDAAAGVYVEPNSDEDVDPEAGEDLAEADFASAPSDGFAGEGLEDPLDAA